MQGGGDACAARGVDADADVKKIVDAVKIMRRHFDQATECVRCAENVDCQKSA